MILLYTKVELLLMLVSRGPLQSNCFFQQTELKSNVDIILDLKHRPALSSPSNFARPSMYARRKSQLLVSISNLYVITKLERQACHVTMLVPLSRTMFDNC